MYSSLCDSPPRPSFHVSSVLPPSSLLLETFICTLSLPLPLEPGDWLCDLFLSAVTARWFWTVVPQLFCRYQVQMMAPLKLWNVGRREGHC